MSPTSPGSPQPIDPGELGAYFALVEVADLLRHAIDQQLREAGDLSYVQFQLLARLGLGESPPGSQRMTELADGVVYSRSGLTYQARLLEEAGLVTRQPSAEDERGVVVSITDAGRDLLAVVLPGHTEVLRRLLLDPLGPDGPAALTTLLGPVREHIRSTPPRSAAPRRRRPAPAGAPPADPARPRRTPDPAR